jgi:hypothetical protein
MSAKGQIEGRFEERTEVEGVEKPFVEQND